MPSSHRRMKGKMIKDTNKSSKVPIKIDYENQEPMMQTRDEFGLPNTSQGGSLFMYKDNHLEPTLLDQ